MNAPRTWSEAGCTISVPGSLARLALLALLALPTLAAVLPNATALPAMALPATAVSTAAPAITSRAELALDKRIGGPPRSYDKIRSADDNRMSRSYKLESGSRVEQITYAMVNGQQVTRRRAG
jgi:hypothetical protein